ncbi:MAG TPA: hypothetical protein VNU97_14120 [Rhizomicrobium sp.]|jgi:hypothetical protein|nr:hypothetical protein [Rhizomicrobium sp.]
MATTTPALGNKLDDVEQFEHDLKLLDGYQSFSAEIVRLSLAALTVIALLAGLSGEKLRLGFLHVPGAFEVMIAMLVALGTAIAAALAHRYASTDSMSWHLEVLRAKAKGRDARDYERERNIRLAISRWSLCVAAAALGVGAISVATLFILFVIHTASTT